MFFYKPKWSNLKDFKLFWSNVEEHFLLVTHSVCQDCGKDITTLHAEGRR
jgi:hypothetical protein